jgi:prepilin-type N-terminal cleavage/methylation domain-containing protein
MRRIDLHRLCQSGLTLTELAVAMAVAGILMAGAYGVFLTQQKTYAVQDQVAEIQQNARVAMNMLARDLRMAGHGKPNSVVTIKGNDYQDAVTVDGDGGSVTLLGCFGAPRGYLSKTALRGTTQIDLVNADDFHKGDRQYIFIGEYDKAIIERIEGNTLTLKQGVKKRYPNSISTTDVAPGATQIHVRDASNILVGDILTLGCERLYVTGTTLSTIEFDTNPITPAKDPLQFEYPSGTSVNPVPVYFVQAIQYRLGSDKIITREDLSGGGGQDLAENIQGLTIRQVNPGTYQITLTARADVPDDAGRFRGRTYDLLVRLRNPY